MSTLPLPGDRPPLQGVRRSFTMPTRQLSIHEKAGLEKADAGADVLYTHPTARIISFSPPTASIKSSSKTDIPADTDYPIDTVETLPWRSRTETLAASGLMIIEKVRGSTNFLKCQDIMHAILRNSQCWCVDGESKFVLRVRKFQYYRIELPSATEEDKAKAEELKKVFPTVLRFERTPCPFIRAFSVDLPDDAITPRRKGPWKRRDSSQPNVSDTESPSDQKSKPTRSWSMKSPPTSYPKNGPGNTTIFERGRPGSSAGPLRRESFLEDHRASSPASYPPSEDDADFEQQESDHGSERDSITDRSMATSPPHDITKDGSVIDIRAASEFEEDPDAITQSSTTAQSSADIPQSVNDDDEVAERSGAVTDVVTTDESHSSSAVSDDEAQTVAVQEPVPLIASVEAKKAAKVYDQSTDEDNDDDDDEDDDEKEDQRTSEETSSEDAQSEEENTRNTLRTSAIDQTAARGSSANVETIESRGETPAIASEATLSKESNVATESQDSDSTHSEDSEESEESEDSDESENSKILKEHSNAEIVQAPVAVKLEADEPNLIKGEEPLVRPLDLTQESDEENVDSIDIQDRRTSLASTASGDRISTPLPTVVPTAKIVEEEDYNDDSLSTVSSADSFHTMASAAHLSSISDDDGDDDDAVPLQLARPVQSSFSPESGPHHKRELSELTVTASAVSDQETAEQDLSNQEMERLQTLLASQISASDASKPEPAAPSSLVQDADGLRQRLRSRRSFSPLPPPSTIFTGNQIKHDSSGHMTKAILQKVIVKPIEVVVLMVHILARIAGGATMNDLLSGDLFKRPEHTRSISGFADQLHNGIENGSDAEDDFGVPIRGRRRSSGRRAAMVLDDTPGAGSEDID